MHGCEPDLTMSAPLLWVVLDSSGVKLLHGLCALSVNEEGSSHLPLFFLWVWGDCFRGRVVVGETLLDDGTFILSPLFLTIKKEGIQ